MNIDPISVNALEAPPVPVPRPLSDLDGPLSHLLAEQLVAEKALRRATANLDRFLAASQVLINQANGREIPAEVLTPEVRGYMDLITRRSAAGPGSRIGLRAPNGT